MFTPCSWNHSSLLSPYFASCFDDIKSQSWVPSLWSFQIHWIKTTYQKRASVTILITLILAQIIAWDTDALLLIRIGSRNSWISRLLCPMYEGLSGNSSPLRFILSSPKYTKHHNIVVRIISPIHFLVLFHLSVNSCLCESSFITLSVQKPYCHTEYYITHPFFLSIEIPNEQKHLTCLRTKLNVDSSNI